MQLKFRNLMTQTIFVNLSSIKTIFAEPIVQNFFDQTVTAMIRKLKPIFDAEFEVILTLDHTKFTIRSIDRNRWC